MDGSADADDEDPFADLEAMLGGDEVDADAPSADEPSLAVDDSSAADDDFALLEAMLNE